MAKFAVTFSGDAKHPKHDPETVTFRGVAFTQGVPVYLDVATPEGEALIKKLKGNRHFKVAQADEEGVKAQPGTPETEADPRNPNVKPDPLDHDGNGKKGGSKPKGKKAAEVKPEAEADGTANA